jgi:hypothetical protein
MSVVCDIEDDPVKYPAALRAELQTSRKIYTAILKSILDHRYLMGRLLLHGFYL